MSKPSRPRRLIPFAWLLLILPGAAHAEETYPAEALIEEALTTVDQALGDEISADDRAWLRGHWEAEAAEQPESVAYGLEALVVARRNRDADPMAWAALRAEVIDAAFCAAERSGDAATGRLRAILAPDHLTLAADCVTDAVVTPFDIQALARSQALVGDLVGAPVDEAAEEARLREAAASGFAGLPPDQQQRLLWGELRAASLAVLLTSVDETARSPIQAAARETFEQNGDLTATAMELEREALRHAGEARVLARAGERTLTAPVASTFVTWLELVAETRFSPFEHAEVLEMTRKVFLEDPDAALNQASALQAWLGNDYRLGKDPTTGVIRAWTADEQAALRRHKADQVFCNLQSVDEEDERRLIAILFEDDPITAFDCASGAVTRLSDEALGENGGRAITRGMVEQVRSTLELIFAVRLTTEERRWLDLSFIAEIRSAPKDFVDSFDWLRLLAQKIETPARVGPHLNVQHREAIAIELYCIFLSSDDQDLHRLAAIIDGHDPVLFKDCERQLVVRASDIGGLASTLNFIASLGGYAPLSEEKRAAMPDQLRPAFEAGGRGSFNYLSTYAKLSYWWSRMPVDVRHRTAARIKEEVPTRDDVFAHIAPLAERASVQTAGLAFCDQQMKRLAFETRRVALASRSIFNLNPHAASPWVNPDAFDNDVAFYGVMAPWVKELCEGVWN